MNDSSISFCADDTFGPTVQLQTCRDGFDFTLLFEESLFTILPVAVLLGAAPLRIRALYRRPDVVTASLLRNGKLVSWHVHRLPAAEADARSRSLSSRSCAC